MCIYIYIYIYVYIYTHTHTHTYTWRKKAESWSKAELGPAFPIQHTYQTYTQASVVTLDVVGEPTALPPLSSVHFKPVVGSVTSPLRHRILAPPWKTSGSISCTPD